MDVVSVMSSISNMSVISVIRVLSVIGVRSVIIVMSLQNQPLRGRLHKAAARPQRRGKRLGVLKFKEIHPSALPAIGSSQ